MKVYYDPNTGHIVEHVHYDGYAVQEMPDDTFIEDYTIKNGQFVLDVEKRNARLNNLNKETARRQIEQQVGDDKDLIADLAKRISMLTRLVIRTLYPILTNSEMEEPYKTAYKDLMTDYLKNVDKGSYYDRADLEENTEMYNKLISRDIEIANIVKTEYLDKKL